MRQLWLSPDEGGGKGGRSTVATAINTERLEAVHVFKNVLVLKGYQPLLFMSCDVYSTPIQTVEFAGMDRRIHTPNPL